MACAARSERAAVILSEKELPLLLVAPRIAGILSLDTTALHVVPIVERLRGTGGS